ncbi:extensin family protein, partial [Camelimonas abortus]
GGGAPDEATAPPSVPALAQEPPASPGNGFAPVAPLPPARPRFPVAPAPAEPAPPPAQEARPAPPEPEAGAEKPGVPSWWPFGRRKQAEEPPPAPGDAGPPRRAVTDAGVDACVARLRRAGAVVERIPAISNGACGVSNGVRLSALPGGLPLSRPGTLSCAMAEATAEWLEGVVQPAAQQYLKARVTGVTIGPTYACRTMNHQRGAKLSEHAYANAIDIAGFQFDRRRPFTVSPTHATPDESLFQRFIRKNACRIFDTVIGPGGDRFHNDHLHLDLRNRKPGRQICR